MKPEKHRKILSSHYFSHSKHSSHDFTKRYHCPAQLLQKPTLYNTYRSLKWFIHEEAFRVLLVQFIACMLSPSVPSCCVPGVALVEPETLTLILFYIFYGAGDNGVMFRAPSRLTEDFRSNTTGREKKIGGNT